MPVSEKWHFVCPITSLVEAVDTNTLPDRWARIADEVYSPTGMYILAWRILKHPEAPYAELTTASYPSTVYDDWADAPPAPEGWTVSRT